MQMYDRVLVPHEIQNKSKITRLNDILRMKPLYYEITVNKTAC